MKSGQYIWHTVGDDKVRASHVAATAKYFHGPIRPKAVIPVKITTVAAGRSPFSKDRQFRNVSRIVGKSRKHIRKPNKIWKISKIGRTNFLKSFKNYGKI